MQLVFGNDRLDGGHLEPWMPLRLRVLLALTRVPLIGPLLKRGS